MDAHTQATLSGQGEEGFQPFPFTTKALEGEAAGGRYLVYTSETEYTSVSAASAAEALKAAGAARAVRVVRDEALHRLFL